MFVSCQLWNVVCSECLCVLPVVKCSLWSMFVCLTCVSSQQLRQCGSQVTVVISLWGRGWSICVSVTWLQQCCCYLTAAMLLPDYRNVAVTWLQQCYFNMTTAMLLLPDYSNVTVTWLQQCCCCLTTAMRRQRSGTFTWCPARRCSLRTQIMESGPTHPACVMGGAQPPFSTTGAAHPTLHLRLLLLRAGDIEVNPGPSAPGAPVPPALDPIHSSAPNARVSSMGTATAWLEINKWVPRATFAAAWMAPPSNPRRLRVLNPITPSQLHLLNLRVRRR